jgi:hypothetical protein
MNQATNAAQPQRAIPNPPGGGSWTFDDVQWQWVSNDPAPTEQAVAEPQLADPTAAPVAEQPDTQE